MCYLKFDGSNEVQTPFHKRFDMVTSLAMLDDIILLIFLAIITSLIVSMRVLVENGP
jgi:hypothetical protein